MKIAKASRLYEEWLGRRLRLIPDDLDFKHQQMRTGAFPFLRATYYRWAQTWRDEVKGDARGPSVLAVGDLHVENFGTWRDCDGRLIWGINDFDEVSTLPYSNDLIRLATSALLAKMAVDRKAGVASILDGYAQALEAGGSPFVLAEHHPLLRQMATARLHDPEGYWAKLHALEEWTDDVPASAARAIEETMPERGMRWKVSHRRAGLGSLGRERYVGVAQWHGGSVAREVKALAPSACVWADDGRSSEILYGEMLKRAVRCPDPFVRVAKRWIVRRLAPDCSRIELSALPKEHDAAKLLHAMGWETANVHLGSTKANKLKADLAKRRRGWLLEAAEKMERALLADFQAFADA
jgi:hypothetical protein